ncbi:uncharacterized protein LOC117122149 isoform X2 [Anneissia japonica]|uniref:uncharacterized protein LOC117122149 isoform X2 n=1 Tax=Anneissia japonica TaxID=1529436 RepID=UPI0014254D1F|nr:uncharacterized protein LOC117122149 isoform X2 [Anneissia japonica]
MELSDAEAEWSEEEVTGEIHSDNEHASTGDDQEDELVSSEESQEEDDDEDEEEEEETEVEVNIDHTDFILDSIDKELNALINKTYPTDQSNGQNGHGLTQSPSVMQKDNAKGRKRKGGKKRSSLDGTNDTELGSGVEDATITDKESSRRRAMEVAEQLLQEVNATDSGNQEMVFKKSKPMKVKGKNGKINKSKKGKKGDSDTNTKQDNLFQASIDDEKLSQGPRFDSSNVITTSSRNESHRRRKKVRNMPTKKRNSSAKNKSEISVKPLRTTGASSDGRSENASAGDGDYIEGVFVQSSDRDKEDETDDVSYFNDEGEESLHQSHTDFSRFDGEESLTSDDQTLEDEEVEDAEEEETYDEEDEEMHHINHKTSSLHNDPHHYKEYPQFKLILEKENDIDSMATEDIVHELDISFGPKLHPPLSPTPRSSYVYKGTSTDNSPRSIKQATQKKPRKKKTLKQKASKKMVDSNVGSGVGSDVSSGLPEYMYIRRPVGESDIGSDSNYTEHYEPLFCASLVYTGEGFKPGLLPRKVVPNGYIPSDVESVQTEDFERRFRHMMVKQVAGVPIMSFDTVTIPSDLDSVKSGDVRETFQTILKKKKGSKNRSVDDFSDQSDTASDIPRNFEGSFKDKRGNDLLANGSDEDVNKDCMDPSMLRYTGDVRNANGDGVRRGLLHTSNQGLVHPGSTRSGLKLGSQTRQNFVSTVQKSRYPPGKNNSLRALEKKHSNRSRSSSDSFINIKQGLDSRSLGHSGSKGRPHGWSKYDEVNRSKKSALKKQGISVPGRFHQKNELPPSDEILLEEDALTYQVSSLKNELNDINMKKKIALGELKMLLDSVHQNKNDIKKADEVVRQHLEKADAARSELMVLEFQRDQAQRELRDVEEETAAKGRTLQELDRRSSHNSREDLMKLGLSTAEIIALVKERDELKERVRHSEGGMSELERTEMQRQLSLSKQELFAEQKNSREKIDKFKEELEEQHHKVEELEYDHEKEVRQFEEKVNDLESKAMKQLTEKNDIIENLERNQKQEMIKMEKAYTKKEQECNALNKIVQEKQEVYDALREKLYGLQEELSKSNETRNQILQEKEQVERNIEIEKQTALLELRDNLLKEKEVELEKLQKEMDTTRQQVVRHQEETFSKQTNKYEEELKEKVCEIELLKGRLQDQESATRGLGEKLRKEAHDQIKSALKKEREIWEGESKRTLEREILKKNEEERWTTTQLKADVAKEKQFSSQLQIALNSLKEELDNLRQENLAMHRQKVEAVSKVREEARHERHNDLEKMREELNQEKTKELEKLKELEKEKDAEIKRLKGELQQKKEREREVLSDYERNNRSILVELNDECKKTSNLLGTTSKKILVSKFQKGTVTNGRTSSSGSDVEMTGKMQVLSALGNMKGCNEDLRNKFQELKQSLEKQKRLNVKASKVREKEKKSKDSSGSSSSLQAMKERLEMEHSEEMESLHQTVMKLKASESALQGRLVDKDSEMRQIQKSMGLWKEETALKMAKKFEEELNKELDMRMQDSFGHHTPVRRSASSDRSASPPTQDASTVKLLRHLQEKVKLLRQENLSLKRGMYSSSHMTADELDTSRELLRKDHSIPKRSHSYGKLP